MEKMKVVVVTGLSGAGKTNAMDWFEDRGFYCVDNMPPALIANFIELTKSSKKQIEKAAFVFDARGGAYFSDMKEYINLLKSDENIDCRILFIEASERTLIKRFNETRRAHPLATGSTTKEVIAAEREELKEIRDLSDYIIDTTNLKVAELKQEISKIFEEGSGKSSFLINIKSFGYKRGIPIEADLVLDMRFIPNPYYLPSLKRLTGNNKKVSSYVLRQKVTQAFIKAELEMLEMLIPAYIKEGKYHLNIAFGCTGGQHRSVATADEVAKELRAKGYRVTLEHRDI
ncbi:MAG: RNase adapter RapZ [[Eubacterium] sulci]|nr:RNase adapter RapZ [[Eubacterium] sulci]